MHGCSQAELTHNRSWLVGTWVQESEDGQFPPCNSDQALEYKADGTFSTYWESGTWHLDEDRLTVVPTEIHPHFGEEDRLMLGKKIVSTLWHEGNDLYYQQFGDDTRMIEVRRCLPAP